MNLIDDVGFDKLIEQVWPGFYKYLAPKFLGDFNEFEMPIADFSRAPRE